MVAGRLVFHDGPPGTLRALRHPGGYFEHPAPD
jgi:hypothetical protein